jgi:hypothetical protein
MTAIITLEDLEPGVTRYRAVVRHRSKEAAEQHRTMGFHDGWGTVATQLEAYAQDLAARQITISTQIAAHPATDGDADGQLNTVRTDGGPLIDPAQIWYHGNSQGGTMGNLVVTLSRDVTRGGLGVPDKDDEDPDSPTIYARQAREVLGNLDVQLVLEPGRLIAGNAGVLISRVEYIKERDGRTFVILDAGMNDLLRPALYGAHHEVLPVRTPEMGSERRTVDIVGPICESTDRFAKDRPMPPLKEGDLVAFMTAGAYGATLSSQYNSRPLVAEALVRGDACVVVRRRPTFDEMIALERAPDWITSG